MDDLLNHAQQLANQAPTPIIQPIEGRVAYLVNQGRGTANNSTQQLAEALNQQGLETLCMVRPGWPWDAEGQGSDLIIPETAINGVRYLHSTLPSSASGCARATLEATVEKLIKLLRVYRPAAVLAEAAGVGLAAWIAAKRLGLAFYGGESSNCVPSGSSDIVEPQSLFVARQALHVFAVSEDFKDALVKNGLTENKIDNVAHKLNEAKLLPDFAERMAKLLKGESTAPAKKTLIENPPALEKSVVSQKSPAKTQPRLGEFSQLQAVELPQKDPLWHKISVKPGQQLVIEAASEYRNVKGVQNRKAVLLINCFNADGKPVDKPCGKMSKSGHLKAYFKYLPCTKNKVHEVHSFTVPKGVSEIKLGLCGFNKGDSEQIFVKDLKVRPKQDKSQPTQFVAPSAQAAEISILGWPEYPENEKPYVIGIMDEFTTGCFEQDVNLIQPRPDNWYALAEKYKPKLFFIESAWKGNYGSWQYRVADYANKPGQEIAHICQYAREKGIPTLFWNKEDPVHHQKFMCSAKLVDHIFTTDANMKDSYQAKTGNLSVHAMPFAAQPVLHKPGPLRGRLPRSCFAGSWYGNRHAERGEAMRWLLQAANHHGLDIFDRNYGTGIFPFPEEYQNGIKGSLPYKALCDEYSRYRIFLNVNSVTDSPTMFSRRVFELMACGTPIVSTYAKGIDKLFESDAVWMVHSQKEADEAIHVLMTNDVEWRRRSLAGIREVFSRHTYAHRLNDIFVRLGIETHLPTDPAIALVAEAHSQAELEVLDQFARKQSYRTFQLGIACTPGLAQLAGALSENITLLQPGQKAAWLTKQQAEYGIGGWIAPRCQYGEHYLQDLANATIYEPAAIGWAKALDQDRFAYGGEALLGGTLWKMAEFLKQPVRTSSVERISRPDLYLADSDQFQLRSAAQQQVEEA
ncbi:MAG: glycosyltransferase [Methylophaga sp.]|uniref:glycosyltransferase family protein n=1 Tax=Methylophaga sp. TaxID=2024840 RepID=UPI00299E8AF5|nr:glycosyltransferase [Methylophaga sp.]MDX1751272.1 glycosyltransferase [Methylophaga sp.]